MLGRRVGVFYTQDMELGELSGFGGWSLNQVIQESVNYNPYKFSCSPTFAFRLPFTSEMRLAGLAFKIKYILAENMNILT